MTIFVRRNEAGAHCLSDPEYVKFRSFLDRTDAHVPNVADYVVQFHPHDAGRWFVVSKGSQNVIAGAVAQTPAAARELWQAMLKLRHGRIPESEPVRSKHPKDHLWSEYALLDFEGVSRADVQTVSEFGIDLFKAMIWQQLESFSTGSLRRPSRSSLHWTNKFIPQK